MFGHLFDVVNVITAYQRMVVLIYQSRSAERMLETIVSHLNV